MSTQKRKDSSRANGAKSRGPVTPEGRARSRAAGLTHGRASDQIALAYASEEQFKALREEYFADSLPRNSRALESLNPHETRLSAEFRRTKNQKLHHEPSDAKPPQSDDDGTPSTIDHPPSTTESHPPSTIHHRPPIDSHAPLGVGYLAYGPGRARASLERPKSGPSTKVVQLTLKRKILQAGLTRLGSGCKF